MNANLTRWTLSLIAAGLLVVGCSTDIEPLEDRVTDLESRSGIAAEAGNREFFVTGVEWKGTTNTESLSAPDIDPTTLSQGYRYKGPGFDGASPANWQVATYVWNPGMMVAYEGDEVTLTVFIVNGDHHSTRLLAPDGTQIGATDDYQRGRETKVLFTATQTCTYRFSCAIPTHRR